MFLLSVFLIILHIAGLHSDRDEDFECYYAKYYYTVLGASMRCAEGCYNEANSNKCDYRDINRLCDDGTWAPGVFCDFKISVQTVQDAKAGGTKMVNWTMTPDKMPAYYQDDDGNSNVQHLVSGSDDVEGNAGTDCFKLRLTAYEVTYDKVRKIAGPVDVAPPLPEDDERRAYIVKAELPTNATCKGLMMGENVTGPIFADVYLAVILTHIQEDEDDGEEFDDEERLEVWSRRDEDYERLDPPDDLKLSEEQWYLAEAVRNTTKYVLGKSVCNVCFGDPKTGFDLKKEPAYCMPTHEAGVEGVCGNPFRRNDREYDEL